MPGAAGGRSTPGHQAGAAAGGAQGRGDGLVLGGSSAAAGPCTCCVTRLEKAPWKRVFKPHSEGLWKGISFLYFYFFPVHLSQNMLVKSIIYSVLQISFHATLPSVQVCKIEKRRHEKRGAALMEMPQPIPCVKQSDCFASC